jgi:hypothetical protein
VYNSFNDPTKLFFKTRGDKESKTNWFDKKKKKNQTRAAGQQSIKGYLVPSLVLHVRVLLFKFLPPLNYEPFLYKYEKNNIFTI